MCPDIFVGKVLVMIFLVIFVTSICQVFVIFVSIIVTSICNQTPLGVPPIQTKQYLLPSLNIDTLLYCTARTAELTIADG